MTRARSKFGSRFLATGDALRWPPLQVERGAVMYPCCTPTVFGVLISSRREAAVISSGQSGAAR